MEGPRRKVKGPWMAALFRARILNVEPAIDETGTVRVPNHRRSR